MYYLFSSLIIQELKYLNVQEKKIVMVYVWNKAHWMKMYNEI